MMSVDAGALVVHGHGRVQMDTFQDQPPQTWGASAGDGVAAGRSAEHGYTLTDTNGVTLTPEQHATVERLLLERVDAKRARQWDACDQLRDQLRECGVACDDKTRTYRLLPPRKTPEQLHFERFGPTGHDYRRDDDGQTVVDEAVVNQLLAQRLRAKMAREYDAADQAKQQLSELGVRVLDKAKTWSAGAICTPAGLQQRLDGLTAQGAAALEAEHGYARTDPATGVVLSGDDELLLHRMLLERVHAKRLRDFAKADGIRAQLREAGCHLNEQEKTFRIQPPRGSVSTAPTEHGYMREDDGAVVVAAADQLTLDELLLQVRSRSSV
eukprot:SAG25_NODE_1658_length_2593_cov_111.862871_2_plen_326_part_00